MVRRLVVGSRLLGTRLPSELAARPGGVAVAVADENRTETLRDEGVKADVVDPTDAAALAELDVPEMVLVACEDGRTTVAASHAVAEAFPEARLIAFLPDGTEPDAASLAGVADDVRDERRIVASAITAQVGDERARVRRLRRVLRGMDRLAIVTHDNPDPDAIASGFALARVAADCGAEADVCYFGDVTHQENRAFINLLELDLRNLSPDEDLSDYDGVALVDHSRPGVNDQLPRDFPVDVVIDHHPPRAPVEARFVDLRSEVGATSTLLVEYLRGFDRLLDEDVATALLFGIRVDTREFTREVSPADFEAAAHLVPEANLGLLQRIESPSISPDTFGTIADAIGNRSERDGVLVSSVGRLNDRDALAQAADRMLTMEGIDTTVVFGVMDGSIYLSARSRRQGVDLGEVLREAFGQIGSAGGHADMAGAQIELGVLESVEHRDESLMEIVTAVVTDRFFEAMATHADHSFTGAFDTTFGVADQYLAPRETADGSPTERVDRGDGSDSPAGAGPSPTPDGADADRTDE